MDNRGRRVKILISLLALVAVVAVLNAMPAAGGAAALEPPLAASSNVQLVANIPGSAAGMVFKDHYAYVSGWGGITVLDIAQADSPQLVGALPLPHFENEDVDLCGNTLIVVNDRATRDLGALLYVVSVANPIMPMVSAVLPLGLTGSGRSSGHIANFVKTDCSQLWVDGGDLVEVVDLTVPTAPRSLGKFESAASLSDAFKVTHDTELDSTGGAVDSKAPVTVNCSSHWFDAKDGIAAVGWYEQGVRFLDYRTPTEVTQVGYYIPANGSTWAAYWSPTDPNGEIVYTADAYRGVDVLKIDGGGLTGKKVKAPVRNEWFGSPTADSTSFQPHADYGFMCPVLKADVDTP